MLTIDHHQAYSPAAGKVNLAKNTPKQVLADFRRGRRIESESKRCPAGIVEEFEIFKMVSNMAAVTGESLYFFIFWPIF